MAVKIRCSECRKKISVDEAFGGSMCRCPYCKAIIMVPQLDRPAGGGNGRTRPGRPGGRPGRPAAPRARKPGQSSGLSNVTGSRPIVTDQSPQAPAVGKARIDTPAVPRVDQAAAKPSRGKAPAPVPKKHPQVPGEDSLAALDRASEEAAAKAKSVQADPRGEDDVIESIAVNEAELTDEQIANIPTADPVRFQGIVTLILLVVLLVLGGLSVYLAIQMFGPEDRGAYINGGPGDDPTLALPENPFIPGSGPTIGQTVPLSQPVVYVIDAGRTMGDLYPFAKDVVRASVLSLDAGSTFGVIVAQDPKNVFVAGQMHPGGSAGEQVIRSPILSLIDDGPITPGGAPNLRGAIDQALANKPATLVLLVGEKLFDDPKALGKTITTAKARLVLLALGNQGTMQETSQKELVESAGDQARRIEYSTGQLQKDYQQRDLPD